MRATASLIRREIGAYFLSPIAYVVIFVFLFVTGYLFYLTVDQLTARGPRGLEFPLQLMLGDERAWLMFLFIPPLLTMRLFAEESSTGTLEMLMTAPVRDWQVVLAKYVAALIFYLLMWMPTLIYLSVILRARTAEGPVDPMPIFTSAVGIVLVGAMFLAIGLFVSSLVRNQLVAALVSMCISVIFVVLGIWKFDLDTSSVAYKLIAYISVPLHFHNDFSRGLIDTRHLVLYVSVTLFCLFLTVRSLESRRWR